MKPVRAQQGYVLMLVLGLLAVGSFVALRLAERIDLLRTGARVWVEYADARVKAQSALATTQYWMATRALHPLGHAEGSRLLREDGSWYALPDGAQVAVQDHRGLMPVNALDRQALVRLLVLDGLTPQQAEGWLDVLEDYQDPDNFHRLNGAEREQYQSLGLTGPRNDWLFSVRELEQMPRWREDPERVARIQRLLHTAINSQLNLNTVQLPVLRARLPSLTDAQVLQLEGLRKANLLGDVRRASAILGLALDEDSTVMWAGFTSRITVWAPGMPQALDYNFRLTPAGQLGPWNLLEHQPAPRPPSSLNERNRALPVFPLFESHGLAPSSAGVVAR